ncbi:hypothetical protein LTR78_000060 [Recurvomyces mirabilis]|uniref:YDG domain-containing protein n=1 Tax=Recurvomyces mirabilis TaxID=574656 RepID=A0AAE1C685_9PEZI|nr:hypothetical protein LTR78_000060 [Recurvomyces mirabilis]KAK5161716.1 hypothetical protein LTS14_000061 [Recurvomyces mirabilis]
MAPNNNSLDVCVNYIVETDRLAVGKFAAVSQSLGEVPKTSKLTSKRLDQIDDMLTWLEDDARMTSGLRARSIAEDVLLTMFNREDFHFPDAQKYQQKPSINERVKWNEGQSSEANDADSAVDLPAARAKTTSKRHRTEDTEGAEKRVVYPRADHAIWGLEGIMHGVAMSISMKTNGSTRKSLLYDDRYDTSRRSAKAYGHNGIEVGMWYSRQLVACFHGAHGHQQAGIYGDATTGAYSIVDDLDTDHGNYLYYSAPNSHNNDDPRQPPEAGSGSLALQTSMRKQRPVRVLRTSTGKSKWAPSRGLRYDGLYLVVTLNHPIN